MSQKNQLPKRSEIAKSDQWRIQDLYANESEWEREYKETQRGLDGYQKFQGRLAKSAKVLFEALQERDRIQMLWSGCMSMRTRDIMRTLGTVCINSCLDGPRI